MQEPNSSEAQTLVRLETERMLLFALSREQLQLCLLDPAQLGKDLDIHLAPEVFSDESRQAIGIKTTRMLLVDAGLHPWYTYFLMVRRTDRHAMGVCGFKGAPTPLGSVELGYAINEDYRNQGYMTEAVRALVTWAFTHEECKRVIAETLRENFASQRVLQKAGLRFDRGLENMLYWTQEKQR
jgi:[ribosomal protein S5]-alanine N-acetyltransferase